MGANSSKKENPQQNTTTNKYKEEIPKVIQNQEQLTIQQHLDKIYIQQLKSFIYLKQSLEKIKHKGICQKITTLYLQPDLELNFNRKINSVEQYNSIAKKLTKFHLTIRLNINVSYNDLKDVGKINLANSFSCMQNLLYVDLYFLWSPVGKEETENLGKLIPYMKWRTLKLCLIECQIDNLDELGKGIGRSKSLQHLHLDIRKNKISDITQFGQDISKCTSLNNLELNLWRNDVKDVVEFSEHISNILTLKYLRMDLSFNKITSGIRAFGNNLTKNPSIIYEIQLTLNNNPINSTDQLVIDDLDSKLKLYNENNSKKKKIQK